MTDVEVAVLGAGPHGLSATTHLRRAGVEVATVGDPMSFWRHTYGRNQETFHEQSRRPNFERPTTVWNNGSRASSSLQTI
jgi:cation diffusion facilitator CzcD-associated flavoprotein CzcO